MNSAGPTQQTLAPQAPPPTPGPARETADDVSGFTGERPGWGEDFDSDYARHVAACRHAATLVAGRRVLDAGCGEGFGTSTLAAAAREVVGVDCSEAAIVPEGFPVTDDAIDRALDLLAVCSAERA